MEKHKPFPDVGEFPVPQDRHWKQDCENAAAKRRHGQFGVRYRALGVTILGDDHYCKQPRFLPGR